MTRTPPPNHPSSRGDITPTSQLKDLGVVVLLLIQALIVGWVLTAFEIDPAVKIALGALAAITILLLVRKILELLGDIVNLLERLFVSIYSLWNQIIGRVTGRIRSGSMVILHPGSGKEIRIHYQIDDRAAEDLRTITDVVAQIEAVTMSNEPEE